MKDVTQMAVVFTSFFVAFVAVQDMNSVGKAYIAQSGQAISAVKSDPSFSVIVIGIVAIILLVTLFLLWHHENQLG